MKVDVKNLDSATVGQVDLVEEIFAREIRADILHRVVTWQLANRRATARAAKERGDVKMTSKKMYRQNGSGSARHCNKAAPQFRKGGKAHGPRARDFDISLRFTTTGGSMRVERMKKSRSASPFTLKRENP